MTIKNVNCFSIKKVCFHILALGAVVFVGKFIWPTKSAPAHRAFYHWSTTWNPSATIIQSISENSIDTLYLRFFDVSWDPITNKPVPVAPLAFVSPIPQNLNFIPVVYLKNEVFTKIKPEAISLLAGNIWAKILAMSTKNNLSFQELQIDCDWTDGSRKIFFAFVEEIKNLAHARHKSISATIRLHQIKYRKITGIPPVDRGMLMFYNVGKLSTDSQKSSIFNLDDAKKYADYIRSYPMELDLVLPIFSWGIQTRDDHIVSLIDRLSLGEAESNNLFAKTGENRYEVKDSSFLHGSFFAKGDRLIFETMSPSKTDEAAKLALSNLPQNGYRTLAFFDLNERNLKNYAASDFKSILNRFQ